MHSNFVWIVHSLRQTTTRPGFDDSVSDSLADFTLVNYLEEVGFETKILLISWQQEFTHWREMWWGMVSMSYCTMERYGQHTVPYHSRPVLSEHTKLYHEGSYSSEHTILCHRRWYFVGAGAGMPDMNPILPLSTVHPSKSGLCWPASSTDQKILKIFQNSADVVILLSWKLLVLLGRTVELTKACNLARPCRRVDSSQVTKPTEEEIWGTSPSTGYF